MGLGKWGDWLPERFQGSGSFFRLAGVRPGKGWAPWQGLALGRPREMGHSLSAPTILILVSAAPPPPPPPLMLLALQLWDHADSIPDLGALGPGPPWEGPNRSPSALAGSLAGFKLPPYKEPLGSVSLLPQGVDRVDCLPSPHTCQMFRSLRVGLLVPGNLWGESVAGAPGSPWLTRLGPGGP